MTSDLTFDAMGTDVRLVVPDTALAQCRAFLEHFEATLSRFRADSELSRLNATPGHEFAASPLLRTAAAAALWAAEYTGGLVDPTLTSALEAAGYDRSRRTPELPLATALTTAPACRRAEPDPAAHWREITVDDRVIRLPPGIRLDTGGTSKGLAADLLANRLTAHNPTRRITAGTALAVTAPAVARGATRAALRVATPTRRRAVVRGAAPARWAVDCGGDLRVSAPASDPFEVQVRHPLTGETVHTLRLSAGAVATSGLDVRLWRAPDGTPRHHILDPATGEPAWTGLIGVTALAPTALEAEALAKAALLSGPDGAARWLRRHGGLAIRDDGDVELHRTP